MTHLTRVLRAISSFYPITNFNFPRTQQHYRELRFRFNTTPIITNPYRSFSHQTTHLKDREIQPVVKSKEKQRQFFFPLWGLGTTFVGVYLFSKKENLIVPAYCEDIIALQPKNIPKSSQELTNTFQLEEDIEITQQTRMENPEDVTLWYKMKGMHQENPFRVKIENGQLVWQAFDVVNPTEGGIIIRDDIEDIAKVYQRNSDRTLIVNTGIHGNKEGQVLYAPDCKDFIRGDMEIFSDHGAVSIFPVSPGRPPYTHKDEATQQMDILDAWCFSAKTDRSQGFEKGVVIDSKNSSNRCRCGGTSAVAFEDVLASFNKLGYKAKNIKDEDIAYVKIKACEEDILNRLKEYSSCYVLGDGGMGKSQISLRIEEEKRKSLEYADTAYIPLRTSGDWTSFLNYVKKVVDVKASGLRGRAERFANFNEDNALKKYFSILGKVAEKKGKKILIVVDNIDKEDQYKRFQKIHRAIKNYNPMSEGPFELLATGRRDKDLPEFDVINTTKISNFWTEEMLWQLFSENFLYCLSRETQIQKSAKAFIENNKIKLLKEFKDFDNNAGIIVTISKFLGQTYKFKGEKSANEKMKEISKHICSSLQSHTGELGDYKLAYLVRDLLEELPTKINEEPIKTDDAKYAYEVLALISDGEIPIDLWISASLSKVSISSDYHFFKLIQSLHSNGLLKLDESKRTVRMACNYNVYMRKILSTEWLSDNERREVIKNQIRDIVKAISNRLKENSSFSGDQSSLKEVNENIRLLLGLMSFSSEKLEDDVMQAEIRTEAKTLAANHLICMPYSEVINQYRSFFAEIPGLEGYSLSPHLMKLFHPMQANYGSDMIAQIDGLINECNTRKTENLIESARELNNCYVIAINLRLQVKEEGIRKALKSTLAVVDPVTKQTIESNLNKDIQSEETYSNLLVFPQINYQEPDPKICQKAIEWLQKNQSKIQETKTADLRGQELNEGLSILVQHLLEIEKVTTVFLGENRLGYTDTDSTSICKLLKYRSGSLKELHLDHNYLYNSTNVNTILNGLRENKSLEILVLNNNSMTDKEIKILCEALVSHPSIKKIYLHHNCFKHQGLNYLQELMQRNKSIQLIMTYERRTGSYNDGTEKLIRKANGAVVRCYERKASTAGLEN